MEDNTKYNYTFRLSHDEKPAKINLNSGEITPMDNALKPYTGSTVFNQDAAFFKGFSVAWEWLYYQLKPLELKVAMYLAMKASPITNSLEPLGNDCSYRELATATDISLGKVGAVFQRLFDIGVYAKFEVANDSKDVKKYAKYWILNPYLSIKSKVIKDTVVKLFENTELSIAAKKKQE